jgi:hypothetical protein
MRRTVHVLVLVLAFAAPGVAQQVDWSKKALQSERSRTYDVLHYRIVIRLDLEQRAFEGETTVSLTSFREGLETVVLDAEEFTVTTVVSDWGEPLKFEQSATELAVQMTRPLRLGETRSFTCYYKGRDPKIGLRFVAETANNPALVFSDSFPDHVHHWFPCFDYPNDKATSEIIATVKSGLKVAANGRLLRVAEDPSAGTVTHHWSQELPQSTYLIFLAAAPHVVVQDSCKSLPVDYWVYPQDVKKVSATYGKTPKMIEFFNRIFGYDYPWQKYDQISVPSGGGAESTSATAMTHSIMVDEKHEVFDFPAETKPLLIRFDEGNVLIEEVNIPKELDELLYQLRNDDVIGRMSAAAALLQFKHDPRTFEALAASAQGEPFWALRRSAIEALGKLQDKRVTAVLKKASLDAHSSVRTSSLAALGDLKDRGLADFFKERFEKDESELVKAEALRAIGKTGDASFIPFLEKCVSIRSYRNNVGNAATQALKQLRTK